MMTNGDNPTRRPPDAAPSSPLVSASGAAGGGGGGAAPAPAGTSRRYSHFDPFSLRWYRFDPDTEARVYEPEDPPLTERERRIEAFADDLDRNRGGLDR